MVFVTMAAADEADDRHAGGLGGDHASGGVLDDDAMAGRDAHSARRMEKEVRCRLAMGDRDCAEDRVAEMMVEAG
jgi:hypothetical protein